MKALVGESWVLDHCSSRPGSRPLLQHWARENDVGFQVVGTVEWLLSRSIARITRAGLWYGYGSKLSTPWNDSWLTKWFGSPCTSRIWSLRHATSQMVYWSNYHWWDFVYMTHESTHKDQLQIIPWRIVNADSSWFRHSMSTFGLVFESLKNTKVSYTQTNDTETSFRSCGILRIQIPSLPSCATVFCASREIQLPYLLKPVTPQRRDGNWFMSLLRHGGFQRPR